MLTLAVAPVMSVEPLQEDKEHIRIWNRFTQDVYALHLHQIEGRKIKEERTVGGYPGDEEYYVEVEYYDKRKGHLISRIRWESHNQDNIHTIEVFVRDKKGRVIRDYTSAYLPHFRNAPAQTLITLHQYKRKLHAFRVFDASAELITEKCTGKYRGEEVFLLLDIDDIYAARDKRSNIMETETYQQCFEGLSDDVTPYLRAEVAPSQS